jgi:hypothetical protein
MVYSSPSRDHPLSLGQSPADFDPALAPAPGLDIDPAKLPPRLFHKHEAGSLVLQDGPLGNRQHLFAQLKGKGDPHEQSRPQQPFAVVEPGHQGNGARGHFDRPPHVVHLGFQDLAGESRG